VRKGARLWRCWRKKEGRCAAVDSDRKSGGEVRVAGREAVCVRVVCVGSGREEWGRIQGGCENDASVERVELGEEKRGWEEKEPWSFSREKTAYGLRREKGGGGVRVKWGTRGGGGRR